MKRLKRRKSVAVRPKAPKTVSEIELMDQFGPQVCSVLDSLEREYRRDEDLCASAPNNDKVAGLAQMLTKHTEKKEAFLKGCTLARRNAETFTKCSQRCLQMYNTPADASSRNSDGQVRGALNPNRDIFVYSKSPFPNKNMEYGLSSAF
jgi:hypothetical protein